MGFTACFDKTPKQIKLLATRQAERTNWNDGAMVTFSGLLYFNLNYHYSMLKI
tara:strand:- start:100 stop:258 length:159 start_codon:yes stop_codon:yes gene_type:complete